MITGEQIVIEARKWLGVPFRHTGRSSTGVDCVGLIICVCNDLGYINWDTKDYSITMPTGFLRNTLSQFAYNVDDQTMQLGDLILFTICGYEQHLAIYTGNNNMIHSYQSAKCVAEHNIDKKWYSRKTGVFRLKEII